MKREKLKKNLKSELLMFIYGYSQYILSIIGIVLFVAFLYSILDLVEKLNIDGVAGSTTVDVILISIYAIISILCFYFRRLIRRKEKDI